MKKRLMAAFACLIMILSASCSADVNVVSRETESVPVAEPSESTEPSASADATDGEDASENTQAAQEPGANPVSRGGSDANGVSRQKQAVPILAGELGTGKEIEFYIIDHEFTQDLLPPNRGGFYTHYQVEDTNNVYLVVNLNVKNVAQINLGADTIANVEIIYDNKYTYSSFPVLEKKDGTGYDYSNITDIAPLTSRKMCYLAEMPLEARDSGLPVKAVITVGSGEEYEYIIR